MKSFISVLYMNISRVIKVEELIAPLSCRKQIKIRRHLQQYKCDLCGAAFRFVQHVLRHKMMAHVPTGAFKCSNCSCKFESRLSLVSHMGRRHPIRPAEESLNWWD
jgi:predicted nucleic acid-binding Zn ribbon protein